MRFPSTVQPTDFQSALHLVRSCGIGITLVVRQLCRIALDRNAREQFEAAGIFVAHCEMEAMYLRGNTPDHAPKFGEDAWQMWHTATLPAYGKRRILPPSAVIGRCIERDRYSSPLVQQQCASFRA